MAKELQCQTDSSTATFYARIRRATDGKIWNTAGTPAFETYNGANITDYDVGAGTADSSGYFTADFPSGITEPGYFYIQFFERAGANPATTDQCVGVQEYTNHLYMVDGACNLDDTDLEDLYTITWLKNGVPITTNGAITSPTIQVFDAGGTDLIASTAMTEIGTSESYKYSATNAERMTAGKVYRVVCTATIDGATRTSGFWVNRDRTDA